MRHWYDFYTQPEWEKRFRSQARKVFANHPEMIDDAFQSGWMRLLDKVDKSKKNQFSDAYIMSMYKTCLIDEYRQHFSRCRPYKWVEILGSLWKQVAMLLCQQNLSAYAIAQRVTVSPLGSTITDHEANIQTIVSQLNEKAYCSLLGSREMQAEEDFEYGESESAETALANEELGYLLRFIFETDGRENSNESISKHLIKQRDGLTVRLNTMLKDEDYLLIRLIYAERLTLDATVIALKTTKSKIRYKLDKILSNIKQVLIEFKIDVDLIP